MGQMIQECGWRLPDELWEKMKVLLPPRPAHPLGCHNPRVPDRNAMDGSFFILRTGCQWGALKATGICSKSSAYRRFREWLDAGVFHEFWRQGLLSYDAVAGIDWEWLSVDGAMTKAPLGGEKNRPQPHRPGQGRDQALGRDRWPRRPARPRGRWRERSRLQGLDRNPGVDPGTSAYAIAGAPTASVSG
jgi:transposase